MERSLAGIRALVTRPAAQAEALCTAIRKRGGEAIALPLLVIEPVDAAAALAGALQAGRGPDLAVFVSANAVRFGLAALEAAGVRWPAGLRCLAVGEATGDALRRAGIAAESGSRSMDSEELLAHSALAQVVGLHVALIKGEGGREVLAGTLRARGALVTEYPVYRRRPAAVDLPAAARGLREARINALLVASGETLEQLLGLLRQTPAGTIPAGTPIVVPGARVAALAAEAGLSPVVEAGNATDSAMLDALERIAARTVEHR